MTRHEVLVEARNILDREGWGQGDESSDGLCAVEAIKQAMGADPLCEWEGRFGPVVYQFAVAAGLGGVHSVADWNDCHDRTKPEVVRAFHRAIAETAPTPDVSFLAREAVRA